MTPKKQHERPYSDSELDRPAPQAQPCRRSASSPPLALTLDSELEDDVFVSPRTDSASDPFSTTNLEIFRHGSARTPAGMLLSPRRERSFNFSVTREKHWRDKGGTDVADGGADVTDSASSNDTYQPDKSPSESSIFSSIIPDKLSGSICTAVIFMLGWKLLANKR
ncbi:unnamed protein product, partial [Iphiclides podalirius]